jgi:ABC-type glutathione transport system ATPase component
MKRSLGSAVNDEVVLSLRDVRIADVITGKELVHGVSFALRRGRVLGIVGESGSGKTLTCRAILGILPKLFALSSGSIALEGKDTAGFTRDDWNRVHGSVISAVFQDPASYLNPAIRVGKQLEEIFRVKKGLRRKAAQAEALRLLEALCLRDPELVFQQFPHELSGGMLQRVLIAAAIALDPQVLIADEATTALDVTVQAEILELLVALKERIGLALVLVSHDLAVVAQVCDEVLVMKSGEVVEHGTVEDILYRPRHAYTRLLIEEHQFYGLDRFLKNGADVQGTEVEALPQVRTERLEELEHAS